MMFRGLNYSVNARCDFLLLQIFVIELLGVEQNRLIIYMTGSWLIISIDIAIYILIDLDIAINSNQAHTYLSPARYKCLKNKKKKIYKHTNPSFIQIHL